MNRTSMALLAILATLLLTTLPTVVLGLTPTQVNMLQLFYNTTGGPQWSNNEGWNTPTAQWHDPCNASHPTPKLFGVTCGNGVIQVLDLQSNGLSGTIPPAFFMVHPTIATVLLLGNPNLGGAIPEFPHGSPMTDLLMSACSFTGTIPASVFTYTLKQLQLEQNQLTGGIPDDIGNCSQLSIFNVGANQLNIGAFPEAVVQCTEMRDFEVIGCGITSLPVNFSHLVGLKYLDLEGNKLSGPIPEGWCSFTQLLAIYLQDNNGLSGSLPSCIANWTQLTNLVIENTRMTGTIPEFVFTAFPSLQQLALSGSQFSGTIPDLFGNLPHLTYAEFNGNNIRHDPVYSGPFPDSLLGLPLLQTISIQYTNVEGPRRSFSSLSEIQTITFSSNPNMVMSFPGELLTEVWASPSVVAGTRALMMANMPLSGTLPQILGEVFGMSTSGGIGFSQTDITGYIPNSTLSWVPPLSRKGLLAGCKKLLYPVAPWMLELTDNFEGMQFELSGARTAGGGPPTFSMAGGDMVGIAGEGFVNIDGRFYCGFCTSGDLTACQGDVQSMPAADRNGNLTFTSANQSLPGIMFCQTPAVATNTMPIDVFLFYIGPAYGPETEYYRVSSNAVSIVFFDPRPTVAGLQPSTGRLEGCTTIYALGAGFLNAPNMTLLIGGSIWVDSGVVINDTAVLFVIPSANASAINTKYPFDENDPLTVAMFATGDPQSPATVLPSVNYTFVSTCASPLVPCANGFHDDQNCPVQPLCRCFSEGLCAIPNGSTTYACACSTGFAGGACEACDAGYYGGSCSPCACSHGTCQDNITGDGSCDCEDTGYIGSKCSISKLGLGIGIPAGVVVAAGVAFLIKLRLARRRDEAEYGAPMNEARKSSATYGTGSLMAT